MLTTSCCSRPHKQQHIYSLYQSWDCVQTHQAHNALYLFISVAICGYLAQLIKGHTNETKFKKSFFYYYQPNVFSQFSDQRLHQKPYPQSQIYGHNKDQVKDLNIFYYCLHLNIFRNYEIFQIYRKVQNITKLKALFPSSLTKLIFSNICIRYL